MYTIPSAHPVHFLMAILAAGAISVSLTSMAAITGLVSNPTATVRPPAFLKTLSSHLPGATPPRVDTEPTVMPDNRQRISAKTDHRKPRTSVIARQ